MVEISNPKWPGWKKHVTSCLYPAEDGLVVLDQYPRSSSDSRDFAESPYGAMPGCATYSRSRQRIRCRRDGLCSARERRHLHFMRTLLSHVRRVIGATAIGAASRGVLKEVVTPLREAPPDCIGCAACAYVCPTDVIKVEQTRTHRKIWGKSFEMAQCTECGEANITKAQRDWMIKRLNLPADYYDLCVECKRKKVASTQEVLARL